MLCPLCNRRKARRACPALGRQICPVCCGTKRLAEIQCAEDCSYLLSARVHPPAAIQHQRQRDREALRPVLQGLTDRQARLFVLAAAVIGSHRAEALQRLLDDDVAQAADALAATLETAERGIVYEHHPASLPAERLITEIKARLEALSREGGSALDRDMAIALRRVERGARETRGILDGGDTAFQQLLARVIVPAPAGDSEAANAGEHEPAQGSALIVP